MEKIGLVLEGGASRGVFTAGVLDYWMEQGITFPYVVGVSAGACNAAGSGIETDRAYPKHHDSQRQKI